MDEILNCDVLIIGGGINGCGIAADAASRGLKVVLCEKNDLGSATSSASSKLIHGGLRYLEQYNFSLVKKALKEREILFKICPYLIKPLKFILPHQQHLRPFWLIKLGLFLYNHLCKISVAKSQSLSRKKNSKYFTPLHKKIYRAFSYFDAKTLDSRLVIVNALQAEKHQAKILTRAQFISTIRHKDHWLSKVKINNEILTIKSKLLINATGPWADQINKKLNIKTPFHLSLVQGSHLVVDKLYEGDFAYILQNKDKRIVFTIPYQNNFTLIGTTDVLIESLPSNCNISEDEIIYLLNLTNSYFNSQLTKKNIRHSYCGLRPLIKPKDATSSKNISRDYQIYYDKQAAPYVCIFGGKLTTYRLLAKECVDAWQVYFPHLKPCLTQHTPLPGSQFKSLNLLTEKVLMTYSKIPQTLLHYYISNYGSRIFNLLEKSSEIKSLGQKFSTNCYQKEVDFLIQTEWAKTSEDIIYRRTKHGLSMSDEEVKSLENYLCKIKTQNDF